ncbi:hypothetical protein AVO42_00335 [Thiomicrospira sp. XS5]|uniref:hypothetical protein n=1 Tax=Thiomicrospira sp. XS5 TaxID=1775636 RepID=UPI000746B247|nr:hypothetical protein [Thiomicrospira sp. XS5]KUJ73903.1 hypothetical protein AVO42_00335 [Thiomicrospira sp. XS5]
MTHQTQNDHHITDLAHNRAVHGLIYKATNAQRAVAFCDQKGLTPTHITMDADTKFPIVVITPPEAGHDILVDAKPIGSKLLAYELNFTGQTIAKLIWPKKLND